MLFIKVTALFLALLLTSAQFAVSARAQNLTSEEVKKPETAEASNSPKEDIVKNPLKPPDTSSPRATLQSFLHNINRAYTMLMAAHQKNRKAPGLFTSESILKMERQVEICRLSDCFTHFISNNFPYQSGCMFRSERAPIGIRNGTTRSSYFRSL